uniref:RNA-directed DNA polymerase, eukaryota, reverse transcriptase zinc-binding domain protein n=1 Tax=Tanacetum cinerariifolium TaxID=118510 RepID=A0A6L2JQN3_TANCI|nr:hypothetical protein [Tanacetum cinerariifolium]
MSPGGSKHEYADYLVPPPKLINGFYILKHDQAIDYGPTLFRLFHSWFLEQDFPSFVKDSCNNDGVHASNAIILLKNKLKSLKQTLKTWSIQKKSITVHDCRVLQDYLLDIDSCLDKGDGLPVDWPNHAKIFHDICFLDYKISFYVLQKAKLAIKGIILDGEWIDNPDRVEREFYNHFPNRFSNPDCSCIPMEGGSKIFCLKVDFQKALDSVRWDHLDDIVGKALFEFNGERCGGNGRRDGSMTGRGSDWLAKHSIVSNEGCGGWAVRGGRSSSESKNGNGERGSYLGRWHLYCHKGQIVRSSSEESKRKGLFGPNGERGRKMEVGFDKFGGRGEEVGNCGSNGGRGGSIVGSGEGSFAICSMESKDGLGGRGLVVVGGKSSSVSKRA